MNRDDQQSRNWERFALLVIDLQKDFWSAKTAKRFPDFPNRVAKLLALCRSEGIEVVHLRARFKPDMSDWMLRYRLRGRIPCVEGTPGVEILDFAVEMPGEKVIFKQTFDGFQYVDLLSYLQERGKRFLLTAGLVTSTCVFLTTASAAQLGFLTAMVEDCCADEPFAHEETLERYQFIFERVKVARIINRHAKWSQQLEKLGKQVID
jgi:nicotinamidase-related amidase